MIAGLLGGPIVGLATALIGGAYRYSMGGFRTVPCSLATLLSGFFGGLVWIWKRKQIGFLWATLFVFLVETFHMALVLAIARPLSEALAVVQLVYFPMTIGNCMGMAVFALIVDNVMVERNTAIQRDRLQQELMQKEIRIREFEIGRLKKYSSDLEVTVQKLEIVIDEDHVRKEAEKVMGHRILPGPDEPDGRVEMSKIHGIPHSDPKADLTCRQEWRVLRIRGEVIRI